MTTGSCHGGLADQALKVRTLHISRDQKPVHNETSSTLLSFFQRSLLLRQSRTALLLRIFSSFLLQDFLLNPSDPHHWFTGMPLLHIKAQVLEVMNLMKTLSIDCCARRRSCDGSTTSLIAQSIVHFHVSRHSLRPDLSQPLECMPCFQSSARVNYPAIPSRRFHEYSCYQVK
ncbi:Serine hydroxymethyltransferase [Trichinella spiralis]|uniref:Serine hydroxymethyltransferase n=1 Tax=Trichinella spiralis TaxID=6334 RepID=A0ABR3K3N8_TRISP